MLAPSAAAPIEFVIVGLTRDGKRFRPGDWAERLCGVMAGFGRDHRTRYSPFVHPVTSDDTRCVVVDRRLEGIAPMAFRFLENFAADNELTVRAGRTPERTRLAELERGGGDGGEQRGVGRTAGQVAPGVA